MLLRGAVALWALLCAGTACAQVSARVAVVSDYRYRGVSLSDDRPAVQASIGYDDADGWYAGIFASSVRIGPDYDAQAQLLPYAGYARRLRSGLSWDAGVQYAVFTGNADYDYPEFHIGLTSTHLSARLYYAPDYFGVSAPVLYGEIDAAYPVSSKVRLLGHAGWLHRGSAGYLDEYVERHRFDARIGIGVASSGFDLQLVWVFTDGQSGRYPVYAVCEDCTDRIDSSGWVLSLSRSW
ncbi:MAG TPA: TorF family putative porin [Lysobacter sp.]